MSAIDNSPQISVEERSDSAETGSQREKDEEIALSIGRPNPPSWRGVWIATVCMLVSLVITIRCWAWYEEVYAKQEAPWSIAAGLERLVPGLWADGSSVVTGVLLVGWLVLLLRALGKRRKEEDREQKLAEAVATNPAFLPFYKEWYATGHASPENHGEERGVHPVKEGANGIPGKTGAPVREHAPYEPRTGL